MNVHCKGDERDERDVGFFEQTRNDELTITDKQLFAVLFDDALWNRSLF